MEQKKKRSRSATPRLVVLSALMMSVTVLSAQNKLTGTVLDESGEPVIGASVLVQGTSTGSVTDLDGHFTIPSVPGKGTLVISYVGFKTQRVSLGQSSYTIILKEDHEQLDEVVVVGYGVQRKSDVTGALAHIDSKQITSMPVGNALEGMQGKTAGVDITNSQRPGTVGSISVRGQRSIGASSAPLYVVDGMIMQNNGIDGINPNDIESIEVLKDASATAIYGARGANGVILVTTKRGKAGAVQVNYAGTFTFSHLSDVAEWMGASEWVDYARHAYYNAGSYGTGDFTPGKDLDYKFFGSSAGWKNIEQAWVDGVWHPGLVGSYDWASQAKQTGVMSEHTLSVSGGTDKIKAYASFGYLNQKGVEKGQGFSRFTFNTNVEIKPLRYFTMGMTMNASYGDQNYGYNFAKSVTGAGSYYSAMRTMIPWTVPYDEDGNTVRTPFPYNNTLENPIDELQYTTNKRRTFRINGSAYGQVDFGQIWQPLDGLSYRIQFGPELRYYRLGIAYAADGINGSGNNVAQYNPTQSVAWTLDNLVYYNCTIAKDHHVGLTLLQSAEKSHYEYGNIKADVATPEELWYNTSSLGDPLIYATGLTEDQLTSYMVRGNYNYKDKYLLTASIRWDGSSRLSEGHKWASFPSFSLGWRIDQEDFMKSTASWLSQLKLRAGYGVTGNYAISPYGTKGAVQTLYYNWGTTDSEAGSVPSDPSAKDPAKMANLNLGWEKTYQWNFGLDYGFLNGSVDVYTNDTKDLLLPMTIPSLTGYTSTYANVGETDGWGVDLQVNAIPVKTRDFSWTSSLTWSLDRNKIKRLANGASENITNRWFVGREIGVYYDYVYDGIWKTAEAAEAAKYGAKAGNIRVKDLDNNDKIDGNDRQIVGKVRPRWTAGWTNTFDYRNWELSFFMYTRWKFTVLGGMYAMRDVDYWVANTNEDAEYYAPGINGIGAADPYSTSMNYQDGSYIKMRSISLGYNFSPNQLKKWGLGINSLKLYVQAQNPFIIYRKCKWMDTDLLNYDNNTSSYGSLTTIRSWVVGIKIGL